jgi:hypothetical protein
VHVQGTGRHRRSARDLRGVDQRPDRVPRGELRRTDARRPAGGRLGQQDLPHEAQRGGQCRHQPHDAVRDGGA